MRLPLEMSRKPRRLDVMLSHDRTKALVCIETIVILCTLPVLK